MTVIARRVRAIPYRSASEAWRLVVDLVAPESSSGTRQELLGIVGIVSTLIMDESLKDSPCVFWGAGPRLRIYCLYGDDATTGESMNEEQLQFCPTETGWQASLPCVPEDQEWIKAALKKYGSHVSVRDVSSPIPEDAPKEKSESSLTIDQEAFLRP
jgi:hypothetical protein